MTELTKRLSRKTPAQKFDAGERRNIIVILDGRSLGLRLARYKQIHWLDLEALYDMAVKAEVAAAQREKKRKGKR